MVLGWWIPRGMRDHVVLDWLTWVPIAVWANGTRPSPPPKGHAHAAGRVTAALTMGATAAILS
jgi:hypothetical protein